LQKSIGPAGVSRSVWHSKDTVAGTNKCSPGPKEKPDEPNHDATQTNGSEEKQTKPKKEVMKNFPG
jgi:hypothetical protein